MSLLKNRLSRNTAALLVSTGGSALLAFGLSVLVGRVLGEDGLGIYATALAWIFPLSLLAEMGIGTLITRDVAQTPRLSHSYVRVSVMLRVLVGGSLLAILWLLAPVLSDNPDVIQGIRLSAPLVLIQPLYSTFTAIFRARQVMQPIAYLNLGMLVAQVILAIAVLRAGYGIAALFVVNTSTSLGQLIAAWIVYRWQFYAPSPQRLQAWHLIKQAAPFAIAAVLAAIQLRLNIILLERTTSTAEVGIYSAALRFVEAGRMLPHAFFDALFPLLASLAAIPDKLERRFRQVLLGLLAFGVVFGSSMSVLGGTLIRWTYGTAFIAADDVLMIAAWALLPGLLRSGRTLYWYAQGYERFVNRITALSIVVQVALAWWLIPTYGASGAALTILLTESIAFTLLYTLDPR